MWRIPLSLSVCLVGCLPRGLASSCQSVAGARDLEANLEKVSGSSGAASAKFSQLCYFLVFNVLF